MTGEGGIAWGLAPAGVAETLNSTHFLGTLRRAPMGTKCRLLWCQFWVLLNSVKAPCFHITEVDLNCCCPVTWPVSAQLEPPHCGGLEPDVRTSVLLSCEGLIQMGYSPVPALSSVHLTARTPRDPHLELS